MSVATYTTQSKEEEEENDAHTQKSNQLCRESEWVSESHAASSEFNQANVIKLNNKTKWSIQTK